MFESIALSLIYPLGALDSLAVTGIFTVIMLALFALALVASARGRAPAFCRSTPTLLTTLGILGTFLGNAIGLLQFDVGHIANSIPVLLDGLKLAFITSIVGIILASCLRLVLVLNADATRSGTGDSDGTGVNWADGERHTQLAAAQLHVLQQLQQQMQQAEQQRVATAAAQHREVVAALEGFAAQLSAQGTEQLVLALESVVQDFNRNLGTQFGENFARLDSAVLRLVEWQEQYRAHMDVLGRQLDVATAGVTKAETSLQALTEQALQISSHVSEQQTTLTSLRRETTELEALLSAVAELRDKAQSAFPAMDKRLTVMLDTIENAVLAGQRYHQRFGSVADLLPHRAVAHAH